jgi:hypothetical protein
MRGVGRIVSDKAASALPTGEDGRSVEGEDDGVDV